jgi:ABC-2 type transport system permease protein
VLGEVLPLTHFLRIIRGIMLKGTALIDIRTEVMTLFVMSGLMTVAALLRFRRTLD